MSIDSNSFFTSCLQIVDSVIGNFVDHVFHALISQHSGEITLCFTLYVILMGYRFATHTISADILTITKHLILMLIVYGLIMNFGLYNKFIYNIFTQEPESLAKAIVSNSGGTTNISGALDNFYSIGIRTAKALLGAVKVTNLTPLFYAAGVWLTTIVLAIAALLLFIYAKMAMAIGLALAPIFLIFMLWDSTRGLFNAWLNKLINFALVPIITCAILSLMLSVADKTLPNPDLPFEQQDLFGIAAFMVLSLATVSLLSRVFHICSALAGSGVSLGGITEGLGSTRRKQSNNNSNNNNNNRSPRGGGAADRQTGGGEQPKDGGDKKESIRNNRADKK